MIVLFFVLLIIGAGIIGGIWWRVAQRKRAAASWPHVAGRITDCQFTQSRDSEGDMEYMPRVLYSYVANATEYTGTRIRYGLMRLDQEGADAIRARYPVGATVDVYFNPAKPSESVLEVG